MVPIKLKKREDYSIGIISIKNICVIDYLFYGLKSESCYSFLETQIALVNPKLIFHPTLEHYRVIFSGKILHYLVNSLIITISATFLAMVFGVPASYSIVIAKFKNKGDNLFFWFISTILLPPVCVIIPIYLIFKDLHVLDTRYGLIFIYMAINNVRT